MLADMHLRNVRQKLMLKKRTEEAVQRLQVIVVVYHRNISNKPNYILFMLKVFSVNTNLVIKTNHYLLFDMKMSTISKIIFIFIFRPSNACFGEKNCKP